MKSIWEYDINAKHPYPALSGSVKTSVLVIGGGITGLLISYFLKSKDIECIVIEAKKIGMGITKNTTAKITSQHGLIYDQLINKIGKENAAQYLLANENAIKKYRSICQDIDCDFITLPSYVYSTDNDKIIEKEVTAVQKLGEDAEFVSDIEIPLQIKGAIKFNDQAQFNPLKFINHLARELVIYENTPAISVDGHNVLTPNGKITAENIIIATHFPFINTHGCYFLKMYQQRSYVMALQNAQRLKGMYLEEKESGLSFREYKNLLIIGGGGHRTGEPGGGYEYLKKKSQILYPNSEELCSWATQDCITLDGIPYIGNYSKSLSNVFVATGFNKWGMSSSMVSAEILSDMITGREHPYKNVFSPQRFTANKKFFIHLGKTIKNFVYPSTKRCSHLGCALKYNKQEHSWDCPCHGSRFTENGDLIDNPATKGANIE